MAVGFQEMPSHLTPEGKLVYLAASLISAIRLARMNQIARTVPVENAIKESVFLAEQVLDHLKRNNKALFEERKQR